jgi:hypothetical protein
MTKEIDCAAAVQTGPGALIAATRTFQCVQAGIRGDRWPLWRQVGGVVW